VSRRDHIREGLVALLVVGAVAVAVAGATLGLIVLLYG
jgi:hypothetical protein